MSYTTHKIDGRLGPKPERHAALLGKRFGKLVAVSKTEKRNRHGKVVWICRCDCGATKEINVGSLTRGTISCGCATIKYTEPTERAARHLLHSYKSNAKRRGLDYALSFEEFQKLTKKPCSYCGTAPFGVAHDHVPKRHYAGGDYWFNGLDRIDNSKGYTPDNVVPCCSVCNRAKHTMTVAEFRDWVQRVYGHLEASRI